MQAFLTLGNIHLYYVDPKEGGRGLRNTWIIPYLINFFKAKVASYLVILSFNIVIIFTGQSTVEIMKLHFAYTICMLLSCINASPSFKNELPTSSMNKSKEIDKFPNVEIAMRGMYSFTYFEQE